jgi:hypothetical protein
MPAQMTHASTSDSELALSSALIRLEDLGQALAAARL